MSYRCDALDETFDEETAKPGQPWPLIAVAAAAMIAVLLMSASAGQNDCRHITDKSARLACFDAAASPQPAKGAPVPNRN